MPEETQDQPSQPQSQQEPQAQPEPLQPAADAQGDQPSAEQPPPPALAAEAQPAAEAPQQQAEAPPEEEAQEKADDLPEYVFQAEDVGTLKKKVTITVPSERIEAKRNELFGELTRSAQVPGFRIGRAPRRLLEKRFGHEVGQDVRNALVGDSLGQVDEKLALKTIGEPELKLDDIKVPDSGPLVYSFEVEVAPQFDLPKLEGIPVEKRAVAIDDERIDQTLQEWRLANAKHEVTQGAAVEGDTVAAGVEISGEGIEPLRREGQVLRVAPGQVEGLPLVDLGKALSGRKAGQTATLSVEAPQAHPNEAWRGKKLTVALRVHEVRRRVLPEIDGEFAQTYGMDTVQELREAVGRSLQARVQEEVRSHMRGQIEQYLLENTELDVPEGAAQRHTARVLQRRYVELLQRGTPRERIDERLTELQAAAGQEARQTMKLEFILGKIAQDKAIEVTQEEVNSRIAEMARQYERRPERLRQELEAGGNLEAIHGLLADEKVLDLLLGQAQVVEVVPEAEAEAEPEPQAQPEPPAEIPPPEEPSAPEAQAPAAEAQPAEEPAEAPPAKAKKKSRKTAAKTAEDKEEPDHQGAQDAQADQADQAEKPKKPAQKKPSKGKAKGDQP